MIKITYICDKCGKETKPEDIFELLAMAPADGVSVPGDVMAALEDRHICRRCVMKMFEKGFEKDEEGHKITKRAEHIETPAENVVLLQPGHSAAHPAPFVCLYRAHSITPCTTGWLPSLGMYCPLYLSAPSPRSWMRRLIGAMPTISSSEISSISRPALYISMALCSLVLLR